MEYRVKISEFEGPLDLLLHLIKELNIDIHDIKVEEITKQYLDYIRAMEVLNLSIASEYLVMAAELIEMKSRSLLPHAKETLDDDYEEDAREALIKKLIDYKQYKEMTSTLKEWENIRQQVYTKIPSNVGEYSDKKIIENNNGLSLTDLLEAFQKLLDRREFHKPLKTRYASNEISIGERINSIREMLKTNKKILFGDLFDIFTKEYVVVTLLSILEMAKQQELIIKQENHFDKIYIELRGSG
jgi:segregation and condensation protein A